MAKRHPEHDKEKKHLDETRSKIDAEIDKQQVSTQAGNKYSYQTIDAMRSDSNSHYVDALHLRWRKPYIGAVEIRQKDQVERVYIGEDVIPMSPNQYGEHRIAGRHSPFMRLFRQSNSKTNNVVLKRRIIIDGLAINEIYDEYDKRSKNSKNQKTSVDRYLVNKLKTRDNARLSPIVDTMTAQQDSIMRYDKDSVLIINGVAGSGKTQALYHRLDYFLGADEGLGMNTSEVIVFVPNSLFLDHAKPILGQLGIKDVKQITFEQWALNILDSKAKIKDYTLETLVNASDKEKNDFDSTINLKIKTSKLKGSKKFQSLLERYLLYKTYFLNLPLGGRELRFLVYKEDGNASSYSVKLTMDSKVFRSRDLTFDSKREHIFDLCVESLRQQNAQIDDLKRLVQDRVDLVMPPFNAVKGYYELLTNVSLMRTLANGLFDDDEVKLLMQETEIRANTIDVIDLPPMLYLHLLANPQPSERFEHVFIDEGQDLSRLSYSILKRYTRGGMTIAGDHAQFPFKYKGIPNWDSLENITKHKVINLKTSYRSTLNIVSFNNQVLEHILPDKERYPHALHIKGFSGEKPVIKELLYNCQTEISLEVDDKLNSYKTNDGLTQCLTRELSKDLTFVMREKNIRNIAIVTYNNKRAKELLELFDKRYTLLQEGSTYNGGVVVIPVSLLKGMEFQAVFIVDADRVTYSNSPHDATSLYVAATRAQKYLYIYYSEEISSHLSKAKDYAEFMQVVCPFQSEENI